MPDGTKRHGRHSWRTAAVVYFSRIGVSTHNTSFLACWDSALVTHGARVAPLKSLTEDFKQLYDKEPPITPDQVKNIGKKLAKLMDVKISIIRKRERFLSLWIQVRIKSLLPEESNSTIFLKRLISYRNRI